MQEWQFNGLKEGRSMILSETLSWAKSTIGDFNLKKFIHLANESVKGRDNEGGSKNKEEVAACEIVCLVTPKLSRQRLTCLMGLIKFTLRETAKVCQRTKEHHVRTHDPLALFALWNLVICLRAKNLLLQPPGFWWDLEVPSCPWMSKVYHFFRWWNLLQQDKGLRDNLPEVIGFLALSAVGWLKAAMCL